MYDDNSMGGGMSEPPQVAKRQRLGEGPPGMGAMGGPEAEGPTRQLATPEDQGAETQERVPIPRSSL